MHYRHQFHAGNFADVIKHVVLLAVLRALNRKDKPWSYLETHAGAGAYDLRSADAARTAEWRDGIGRLAGAERTSLPPLLQAYLGIVENLNGSGELRCYPGSPLIARSLARASDAMVLCEKVPEVQALLRQRLGADGRISLHGRDGYEAHALLPPPQKRGLVLIDPPFERADEFEAIADFLQQAQRRFSNGIYAVWYPLKNRFEAQRLEQRIARRSQEEALVLHFENGAEAEGQMRACAMLMLNPPFQLAADLEPSLRALVPMLAQGPTADCRLQPLRVARKPEMPRS